MSLKTKKKIIVFSNSIWYLNNFKFHLINSLSKRYKIIIIIPYDDIKIKLKNQNVEIVNLNFYLGNKLKLFEPIFLLPKLIFYFKKFNPDLVINYTAKCNFYGSLISKILCLKCINNITGLGSLFLKDKLLYMLIRKFYFFFLNFSNLIITQNESDLKYFSRFIKKSKIVNIESSGIKIQKIKVFNKTKKEINFLMISRIIKEKGVNEFLYSAKRIINKYPNVNFLFYGKGEGDELHKKVKNFSKQNIINYKKFSNKIINIINKVDCIVLPSYREGTSRTLLEACLCSKPIIATNVPGCNNVAIKGYNAILCKPKNVNSLTFAIESFLKLSHKKKQQMGLNSRKHLKKFDVVNVNNKTINMIDSIIYDKF